MPSAVGAAFAAGAGIGSGVVSAGASFIGASAVCADSGDGVMLNAVGGKPCGAGAGAAGPTGIGAGSSIGSGAGVGSGVGASVGSGAGVDASAGAAFSFGGSISKEIARFSRNSCTACGVRYFSAFVVCVLRCTHFSSAS